MAKGGLKSFPFTFAVLSYSTMAEMMSDYDRRFLKALTLGLNPILWLTVVSPGSSRVLHSHVRVWRRPCRWLIASHCQCVHTA